MSESKTRPTCLSVDAYLDALGDDARRADCRQLVALLRKVTGCPPVLWGDSIVGFDSYHYEYPSGRQGDSCMVGFSSRKANLSIYLLPSLDGLDDLLAELGKHKASKACLSVKRLADIKMPILEQLVARSYAEMKRLYPS
jgi:hypothetical protein